MSLSSGTMIQKTVSQLISWTSYSLSRSELSAMMTPEPYVQKLLSPHSQFSLHFGQCGFLHWALIVGQRKCFFKNEGRELYLFVCSRMDIRIQLAFLMVQECGGCWFSSRVLYLTIHAGWVFIALHEFVPIEYVLSCIFDYP